MNFPPRAQIYQGELQFISECVVEYPDLETGGDFFGFWSREGNPVIQYVLGPGNQTSRTGTSFFQDIEYLRECGTVLHNLFGLEHIGAWHSHHQLGLLRPSVGDVRTMRNALRNRHPSRFLISICNIDGRSSVSIGCFLFSRDDEMDYSPCDVLVLPGDSPVRDRLRREGTHSPLAESRQRKTLVHPPSLALRNTMVNDAERSSQRPEKPRFGEDSYWSKREGQRYLKTVFDKLRHTTNLSAVDIKQLADGRPAISFSYDSTVYEIRFPEDFPRHIPEVLAVDGLDDDRIRSIGRSHSNRGSHLESVQRLIDSLQMLDDGRSIIIEQH
jgi:hypothetical protein